MPEIGWSLELGAADRVRSLSALKGKFFPPVLLAMKRILKEKHQRW